MHEILSDSLKQPPKISNSKKNSNHAFKEYITFFLETFIALDFDFTGCHPNCKIHHLSSNCTTAASFIKDKVLKTICQKIISELGAQSLE